MTQWGEVFDGIYERQPSATEADLAALADDVARPLSAAEVAKGEWTDQELANLLRLEGRSPEVASFFQGLCADAGFAVRLLEVARSGHVEAIRLLAGRYDLAALEDHEQALLALHEQFDTDKDPHIPTYELLSDLLAQLGSGEARERLSRKLRRLQLANKHRGWNRDLDPLLRALARYERRS